MPLTITSIDDLTPLVGTDLGTSDWLEVTQDRIQTFADATGDQQWIHVDVERATAESPFGGPIAHGYLTLSLAPTLMKSIWQFEGTKLGVNYGLGKVRFPSPVPSGAKLRLTAALQQVEPIAEGTVQLTLAATFEVEGATKPACVAELIYRYAW